MKLVRLNKVIEETDPERIREYKLLGFTEEGSEPETSGAGREPVPQKPTELTELPQEPKTRKNEQPRKQRERQESRNESL